MNQNQAHHKVDEIKHEAYDKAHHIAEDIEKKLKDAGEKLEEIQDQVKDLSKQVVKSVEDHPVVALSLAVAFGVLIGKLLK